LVRWQRQTELDEAPADFVAFLARGERRIDRPRESAFSQFFQEDGAPKQLLEDADREAHLIRLVPCRLPTAGPDEFVQVQVPMRGGAVELRWGDVLLPEDPCVGDGLQVTRAE